MSPDSEAQPPLPPGAGAPSRPHTRPLAPGPWRSPTPRRGPPAARRRSPAATTRRCPPRPPRPPSAPRLRATGREQGRARSTTGSRRTLPRRRSPERKRRGAASVVKGRAEPLCGGAGRRLYGGARPEARAEGEAGASASPGRESVCEGPGRQPGRACVGSRRLVPFSAEAPRGRAGIQACAGSGASGARPGSACPG